MISCDIFGTGSHDIYIFIINIIIFKYLNYMIGRDILFQLDHNKCMSSSGLLWALTAGQQSPDVCSGTLFFGSHFSQR